MCIRDRNEPAGLRFKVVGENSNIIHQGEVPAAKAHGSLASVVLNRGKITGISVSSCQITQLKLTLMTAESV